MHIRSNARLAALVLTALVLAAPALAQAADLTLEVKNVQGTSGQILVALFNKAEGFPHTYWKTGEVVATPGVVKFVFTGIPEGTYAATAFHDQDNNKKLRTNGLGIPTEPLAFSNNAIGRNGPPAFSDASFKFTGTPQTVTLTLK
ncbi:DUF2141 domain-containing protein [Verminephrobacter eiseniae]|uniref:DUF2141 domain-containing protein n=1 Tax=Verminephrobacter eiseniae TaxID=364317 RepID=UPI002238DB1C|nr:DUF2141 domain-containing protein [Verminephrobacter eiseniae]MCW5230843.1 DUF2141 domain-containing protein [Verminephrobacter eiseniae]MCW5292575.1 DUF2141 domain-containing protein [Verminephrobacter eiseniae]MCW8185884.1 DUF2141 domain-containing protein [Verminephrobacter eiseniae]MCW8224514.1 DUF2141 domain-containing protein [Verminephrobacter eiseniae]MCW8235661.1 DUF2141 domain-containing protein [Verminephrobacter eiseniae]